MDSQIRTENVLNASHYGVGFPLPKKQCRKPSEPGTCLSLNECMKGMSQLSLSDRRSQQLHDDRTELDLSCRPNITDKELSNELKRFPGLKSLTLFSCEQLSLIGVTLPTTLEHLSLQACFGVTDESLKALESLTSLTSLNLSYCFGVKGSGLKSLQKMGLLKTLQINGFSSDIQDSHLRYIEKLPIEELNISGLWNLTDACIEILTQMPRLKTVEMKKCPSITYHKGCLALTRKLEEVQGEENVVVKWSSGLFS